MVMLLLRCFGLLLLTVAVAPAQAAVENGSVTGTVALEAAKAPLPAAQYRTRTRARVGEPEAPRAIVYLERDDGIYPDDAAPAPAGAPAAVAVEQQGYQFRPALVAVRRGTPVAFPNRDDEFHSVFSYSAAKRFDLGRFRRDEDSPLIVFDQAGLVKVYCEIHKHMRGLVLVLETPWFTTTDEEGRYVLDGVPPGDYRVRAFLPSERTLTADATVTAGESVRVDLAAEP